jgi:hypothetical protein
MKRIYWLVLLLLVCPLTPVLLSQGEIQQPAQGVTPPKQQGRASSAQALREMIYSLRATYLLKELKLPEERAKQVLENMQAVKELRQQYLFQRSRIEHELDVLLQYPTPDHTKLTVVLQELETTQTQYYQHVLDADRTLRTLLSPEEQAKYVLFQKNFNKTLQDMIVSIRQHSPRPPSKQNFLLRKQETESVIRQPH